MTGRKYERYYELAGRASFENWDSVRSSIMCGCYFCRSIFPSTDVTDGIQDRHGKTAMCPVCSVDSVIGDASGIPIRKDVLEELYCSQFRIDDSDDDN